MVVKGLTCPICGIQCLIPTVDFAVGYYIRALKRPVWLCFRFSGQCHVAIGPLILYQGLQTSTPIINAFQVTFQSLRRREVSMFGSSRLFSVRELILIGHF